MNTKIFQFRKAIYAALLFLLISVAGATKAYAYDFYAVCPSGQILYFNIIDSQNHYVEITCPYWQYDGHNYNGYTKPSGFLTIPETVEKYGQTYTVTRIGSWAFVTCYGLLGDLIIPNTVTSIGQYAFSGCTGYDGTLVIPNTVRTIEEGAFYNCQNIYGTVVLPENLTSVPSYAFYFCQHMTDIVIPNTVTYIGYGAFHHCIGLTHITLPQSLVSIGGQAFYNCTNLTGTLTIPNSVQTISNEAFYNCSGFTGPLELGNSLTSLGEFAFDGCSGISSLTLPNTLQSIGRCAFAYCSGITGELIIPNSVTFLGYGVFIYCNFIEVTIPSSIETMYEALFAYNANLTTANFNATNANMLMYNSNMNTYWAIYRGCTSLTTINIGPNVTSIPPRVFQGATNLSVLNSYAAIPPTTVQLSFQGVPTSATIHVPSCSLEDYQSANQWNQFTNWQNDLPCPCVFNGNGGDNLWSNASNWTVYPSQNDMVMINAVCELDVNAEVSDAYILGKLIISSGKTFNVTGQFVNTGMADKVIIRDGGQLLHCSNGVEATVKKNISFISNENEGWHLFASPLTSIAPVSSVQNLTGGDYDLYYYDELTHYWMNQEFAENGFNTLTSGKGYLYANAGILFFDFEDGMSGWTTIDADGNGMNWVHSSNSLAQSGYSRLGCGHNNSDGFIYSQSYVESGSSYYTSGAYNADNYIVSPQMYAISDESVLGFYYDFGSNYSYYQDYFEVCIATAENPNANDFTPVWVSASSNNGGEKASCRNNKNRYNNWTYQSVDLSAFANQNVWIAFHHVDYDKYEIWIDDVELINMSPIGELTTDVTFAGPVMNGSAQVSIPLSYTEGIALSGFNLVGNPYLHNVTSYVSENVAEGCYRLNEAQDNIILSEISEVNPLRPAEGFFVKALSEDASITFNPERKDVKTTTGSICMEITENGQTLDRLIVKRGSQGLEKLSLNENSTKLFAIKGQQEMAIVPMEGNMQAVSFKAAKNGTYMLNVKVEDMDLEYLHLIDNLTGEDIDFLATSSYTFEAKTSDALTRFTLALTEGVQLNTNDIEYNRNQIPILPPHDSDINEPACPQTSTQEITLAVGWNWFSTYIDGDPVELLTMLEESLGEHGILIESLSDGVNENLGDGFWMGDLDGVGVLTEQMYMIEVDADCTVELQGTPANPANHAITIYPGQWNWIGFPCSEEVDLAVALSGFEAEEGDLIESLEGGIAEYLGDGLWMGFETMVPGQGYMYYSNSTEQKTLIYVLHRGKKVGRVNPK